MSRININYEISEGQHGMHVITRSGRCTHDTAASIISGCTRRYDLVPIPNASGAVFKSLDGSVPHILTVRPPTLERTFLVVKIAGYVNPFAPEQDKGPYQGKFVLQFVERYQEVSGVS